MTTPTRAIKTPLITSPWRSSGPSRTRIEQVRTFVQPAVIVDDEGRTVILDRPVRREAAARQDRDDSAEVSAASGCPAGFPPAPLMSALGNKRTFRRGPADVRFAPESVHWLSAFR